MSPGALGVGAASLCSDAGHEMVTSLLPTFLASTLHSGPTALGAIDGVADALTGLTKLAGGPLANDPGRRGKLASSGYLGTAVATAAIGFATAVWQVAILRGLAWMSRGIRSPARDMLLTTLSRRDAYGRRERSVSSVLVTMPARSSGRCSRPVWWACSDCGTPSCSRSSPARSRRWRSPSRLAKLGGWSVARSAAVR